MKSAEYRKSEDEKSGKRQIGESKSVETENRRWEDTMGEVMAVCISERKGTQKQNIGSGLLLEDWGIEKDAHAGKWHRQISLLSYEKVEEFRKKGRAEIPDGAFGENLLVKGIDFAQLPVGTRFRCGEVELELTQIGKECHSSCEIRKVMGDCIMPREGVFCRVLKGGRISVGDELTVESQKSYRVLEKQE